MKTFLQCLLTSSALLGVTISAPTPAPEQGPSFPITDLLNTDLTIEEYAKQLEEKSTSETSGLSKRQFNGDTYNQLTDGTPCREITVIYARGTTQDGNVGAPDTEGPNFFNALAAKLGGTSRLAIQGVTYPANVFGFLAGGDSAGSTTTLNLINTAASKCPSTKIVLSGYTQKLSASVAARVNAVVVFGDPDRDEGFGPIAASKILIICHDGDNICDNGIIITPQHRNYEIDAPAAANFVASKV
ncbi:carbohydrate esterase family 5 protein [Aaosphaeria arxii CBS 175.79]|uniref:cutinase n=1 Tax=Aaosphaeria arxii CBS 175.79 TaxID=1450172 RepID=A0A6A5XPN2_9PLEO|nr:carbohydrate esterase family 5 protein [Aaosphaeria arxii CBS 175.79]KAF2015225.1 carbohydrate esterase family 5 protein [Aaosphaeria arxii CBS 175.79]